MPIFRCQSTLKMTSLIPEDSAVNTFHVLDNSLTPAFADWETAWRTFMNAISGFYPNTVAQNDHSFKVYDLTDPEPRAPVYDSPWSFSVAPSNAPLPSEIALCLSFQGDRVSGQPQARRRGRMYIGPISTARMTNGRPIALDMTTLSAAGAVLAEQIATAGGLFGVFSRANGTLVEAAEFWVDNAFDVQRRRGLVPTSRSVSPVT